MVQKILGDKIISVILFSLVLIALVVSDVIVLDEEALVAACFLLFVLFAYRNLGDVIANELEDRSARIQKELQKSFDQQRELLSLQIEQSLKQVSLMEEVQSLYSFSKAQMFTIAEKRRQSILNRISTQANQQLRYVSMKEKEIVDSLQRDAVQSFSQSVLEEFQSNTPESIQARADLLDEGIEQLALSTPISNDQDVEYEYQPDYQDGDASDDEFDDEEQYDDETESEDEYQDESDESDEEDESENESDEEDLSEYADEDKRR